jgi:hypothetical protein
MDRVGLPPGSAILYYLRWKDQDMKNYMSMKNEELYELIEKYDLDKKDYLSPDNGSLNRKKLGNILKLIDIQAGRVDEAVVITEDGDVQEHKPKSNGKLHKSLSGMMVEIQFYSTDENDLPYAQLALNGIALIIPKELKTWIPKEFIDGVLQNAIATKMKMDVDRDGKIRYIPKQVPRLQHTVYDVKHIDVLRKEYDEAQKNKGN